MTSPATRKSGSALLFTLMVTSLLMLVVLSFTVFVRLELRSVATRQEMEQARRHARLSMHLALEKLQTMAGPDRRVTARADLLGAGVSADARHWTGVWASNGAGGLLPSPVWLVADDTATPLNGPAGDSMALFPSVGAHAEVRVPVADLEDAAGKRVGRHAYWVSDEGTKASLRARHGARETYSAPTLEGDRRLVEYQADFGVALDPFFNHPSMVPPTDDVVDTLHRVARIDDVRLAGPAFNPPAAVPPHHDATPMAFGVLENARDGGLKANLSDPDLLDGFLATEDTHRFLAPKYGALQVESGLPADRGVMEGQPWFSPRPLLTEAVLYMGMFHTNSDAKLRIRYHVQSEFMNPYTLPLEFPRDTDSQYDRGLVLVFENLPTVRIEDTTPGTTAPVVVEDLDHLSAYSTGNTLRYIHSWFEISPDGSAHTPRLNPGEVYQVMEPNPNTQPRGLARDLGTVRWSNNAGTKPDPDAWIRVTASHPSAGLTLKGVPYERTGDPRNRRPLFEYSGLAFTDFTLDKRFNTGPNPFSRPTSSSYLRDDYVFAYHFRLLSDETDPASMRDLLTAVPYLDPDLDFGGTFEDRDGNTRPLADVLDPISDSPDLIVMDDVNLFSKLDQMMDLSARSHHADFRNMLLVDVPDGDALSIGQLSSLPIYRRPARVIGSPNGGEYNLAFDRYFLSPKRAHPDTGDPILIHPGISPLSSPANAPAADDAARELVEGAFNLNSTSVDAWEAVLAAPVLTPEALDEPGTGDTARAAFFRLPQYQSRNSDFVVTDLEIQQPDEAFAQGIRSLHTPDGRARLRRVAEEIVTRVRSRAEPFPDLATFVDSGILQEAIDAVPAINDGLYEHANVYLTQQDLLTKIAPALSVRSDTFTIRAYGEVRPEGAEAPVARALCEAVVQRLPTKLDGSDPMSVSDRVTNAREFKIVSFRWLQNEED